MADRSTLDVINEYELLLRPASDVMSWLEERFKRIQSKTDVGNYQLDEAGELALLARKDSLINLGLAKYGHYIETARELLKINDKALRLFVFRNEIFGSQWIDDIPVALFNEKRNDRNFYDYLKVAPDDEISEIFKNPAISDNLLENFFKQQEVWREMRDDDQRIFVLRCIGQNPRIKTPYSEGRFSDGYAEYRYDSIFNAAWLLAEVLPVETGWAIALNNLYSEMLPEAFSIKDPVALSQRWYPVDEYKEKEEVHLKEKKAYLSLYQNLRKSIAGLKVGNFSSFKDEIFNHEDIAVRCVGYSKFYLQPDHMEKAYERDGELALNEMTWNGQCFQNEQLRNKLHELCKRADAESDKSWSDNVQNYWARESYYEEKVPRWFKESESVGFDEKPDNNDLPATKGYLHQLADIIQGTNLNNQSKLYLLEKQIKWIWWMCLISVIALVFYKH